jgi:2-amino-4-hydroxy-6-hydroxymethyldihydropteridine diphosphokinase
VKDIAYLALGSNIGQREVFLAQGRKRIGQLPGTRILGETEVEETAPLGPIPQEPFLNQMIAIETELPPRELLEEIHRIEADAGRVRDVRWGPRTLDIDIVLFERQSMSEPDLTVPHPELANRSFWLSELATLRGASVE